MDAAGKVMARSARLRQRLRCATCGLAASLAGHAVLLWAAYAAGLFSAPPAALPVAFVPLTAEQWEVNRAASGASDLERRRTHRIIELPPDVERDPLRALVAPLDARHLAWRDQRVEDERVSRDAGSPDEVLRVAQRASEGVEGTGERGRAPISVPGREGPRGAGGRASRTDRAPAPKPSDGALAGGAAVDEEELSGPPFEAVVPVPGADGGKRIVGERIPGRPVRELPRPEGGPNMDGFGEVPEGDETRLDAHEVDSAAFWVDVRRRIEGEWQKRAVVTFGRVDPKEDVYFWKQRTAVLKVALGAAGELKKVEVVESSSLGFFDDVALEAIRASTYPPPPPEALGGDGEASIQVRITWVPSLRRVK